MKIPDYISPVVGHRVWRWDDTGLKSLNGEPWLPGQHLEARCRVVPAARHLAEAVNEVPHRNCTCGVYAAKDSEHLRQIGYADDCACGEVYLWGIVIEHTLGWRAQFAYPKNLVLPLHLLPFTLAELKARLFVLAAFGVDIFVLHYGESMRLWKRGQGFDAAGLDYLIKTRKQYYVRCQWEGTLKKGDRVAVLGRGIAVVERIDGRDVRAVLGNRRVLRILRKGIVWNEQNSRWEAACV